jgi:hypothetical protein
MGTSASYGVDDGKFATNPRRIIWKGVDDTVPTIQAKNVAVSAAKMAVVVGVLGLIVGAAKGIVAEKSRINTSASRIPHWMPPNLAVDERLVTSLKRLSQTHNANMKALARVARRCSSMIRLQEDIQRAASTNVDPVLKISARKLKEETIDLLYEYYRLSYVPLGSPTPDDPDERQTPLGLSFRLAHLSFIEALGDFVDNIALDIEDQMEAKQHDMDGLYSM